MGLLLLSRIFQWWCGLFATLAVKQTRFISRMLNFGKISNFTSKSVSATRKKKDYSTVVAKCFGPTVTTSP